MRRREPSVGGAETPPNPEVRPRAKRRSFSAAYKQRALATVSTAPGRMIIDGGSKTFSSDRLSGSSELTFGEITEAPNARFHKMNEEHGFIDLLSSDAPFSVGDRVHVLPNHICVAMNLHESVYAVRGDDVVHTWRVEGRGKLQ